MDKLQQVFPGLECVESEEQSAFLSQAFLQSNAADMIDQLRALDVAVASPESIVDIRASHTRLADGVVGSDLGSFAFSAYPEHPGGRAVTHADHYAIRPTLAGIRAQAPAPVHGAHTLEVLRSVHFSEEQIQQMVDAKLAATTWGPFMPK
jgi:crotonobetainyl-CoA:carnitine CoA-transferase CaiB-like acyl-CoA transferase